MQGKKKKYGSSEFKWTEAGEEEIFRKAEFILDE